MNKPLDKTLLEPAAGEDRWLREYAAQIGTDKDVRNRSGIAIKPMYTPRDWNGDRHDADVGFPGQPPYTRGIYATMHRGRTWTQRQLIGLGTPRDYNARLTGLIAQGAGADLAIAEGAMGLFDGVAAPDRKSTRLNSSH